MPRCTWNNVFFPCIFISCPLLNYFPDFTYFPSLFHCLDPRWNVPTLTAFVCLSFFSPRWLLIHQGHSCVWIMSELRSKYLSMTSCLDWCSCAIWFFMYHGQDSWTAVALQEKGCPASAPETLRRKRRLSGLARTCKAAQNVTLTLSCSDEMPGWGNESDMLYIFKNRPFRNLNQFRGNVTRRLKAGDWYHVNPAKLYTSITRLRLNLTPT